MTWRDRIAIEDGSSVPAKISAPLDGFATVGGREVGISFSARKSGRTTFGRTPSAHESHSLAIAIRAFISRARAHAAIAGALPRL